jgi:hypothetical protein
MTMIYQCDDRLEAEQLRARPVGEPLPARAQPQSFEDSSRTGAEIDQQVERVRWLMRREPVLEGRELRIENRRTLEP